MARKSRNDIDYFPHSVNHGKKMFYIRSKYKNDGYAVWFMLLEHLGRANYHFLDLLDKVELMYLSSEFSVTEELLIEIINSLVEFGEFDKELWEKESILFNEKFIDNISDAYRKRGNEIINKKSLLRLLEAKGRCKPDNFRPKPDNFHLKGGGNPQRIVKDSKEKKSKEVVYDKTVHDCFNICLKYFPNELHPKDDKSINNWLDVIEKLNRIDEVDFIHIGNVVQLIRDDDFWSRHFLSITKLRKKNKDGIIYIKVFSEHLRKDRKIKKGDDDYTMVR